MTDADGAGARDGRVRPYLGRPAAGRAARRPPERPTAVRPYSLTGGRTRPVEERVGFETLVVTTERGEASIRELAFERRAIATLCARPRSVAEVAASLQVPVGVARVLAGDMTGEGLLELRRTPADAGDDVGLLTRLIAGVRAL